MEVETALQALQELLDSDLRRRRRELQESLTVLEVETDECVPPTRPAVISDVAIIDRSLKCHTYSMCPRRDSHHSRPGSHLDNEEEGLVLGTVLRHHGT